MGCFLDVVFNGLVGSLLNELGFIEFDDDIIRFKMSFIGWING